MKAVSSMGGGAERVFASVVNGLSARGHDVSVLTFESASNASFYHLSSDIARYGLDGANSSGFHLMNLRRMVSSLKPDVVIGFMPSCYVPLGFALAGAHVPLIASEHNVPMRYRNLPLKWFLINLMPLIVCKFTAVSNQARAEFPLRLRKKMRVVFNPVVQPRDKKADVVGPDDHRTVLAVGRLHSQKDHLTLVRAFASIASDFPEWVLKIVGDGAELQNLEEEITQLNISDRITLTGTTRNISEEYLGAQLYVIPSRYESYGLATAEAFAHGLPAIGFADCPGTNRLIEDQVNGLLVDPTPSRVDGLASALKAIMSNSKLRVAFSKQASTAWREHSIENVLDQWENLLQASR